MQQHLVPPDPMGRRLGLGQPSPDRRTAQAWQRARGELTIRGDLRVMRAQVEAEVAAARNRARYSVATDAGYADMVASTVLNRLPINDELDADYRRQLLQAARTGTLVDLLQLEL